MTKITQKQLIESLQQLKEIKPRKEWAVLLKFTLLENKVPSRMTGTASAQSVGFIDTLRFIFAPRKLEYAFVAALLLIVGVFGFTELINMPEQSPAALTKQSSLTQNTVAFSSNVNNLVQISKEGKTDTITSAISEIKANASRLAKNLKDNPTQDPQTIKEIAVSLKTLADMPGTDLTASADMQDLYQTVVQNQIADLQKTTLTDDQTSILTEVQDLYNQGKYTEALEQILLINK